jgi:PAS domain S-box-containing protein
MSPDTPSRLPSLHNPPPSDAGDTTSLAGVVKTPAELAALWAEREEFYYSVLENLAEGVLITNHESRIVYANSRVEEITGYRREEILGGVSYKILTPRENWPAMEKRLKERLSGKTENYEHQLIRKDGETHWVSVKATPYRNCRGEIIGTVGAISCIQRQKDLEEENEYLADEIRAQMNFGQLIGSGPGLGKVLEQIRMVAATRANVLILGESGVGKELVARAIHEHSERKARPMVRVNCASIPKELFESEFFGHARGAFTGAIRDRAGRFELADGGTLFLDEIGEIPPDLQGKLLRVLQEGQFERVGEDRTRTVDVRVVAASNRDLLAEARSGRFRIDLYYRLSVFPIEVPPLRERQEDIGTLAEHFVQQAAQRMGVPPPRLLRTHVRELTDYDWPGNVRELQNVIERAVIRAPARGGRLEFDLEPRGVVPTRLPAPRLAPTGPNPEIADTLEPGETLNDLKRREHEVILRALEQSRWKIYGVDGAAAYLRLKPTTLASRMRKLGLRKPAPTA